MSIRLPVFSSFCCFCLFLCSRLSWFSISFCPITSYSNYGRGFKYWLFSTNLTVVTFACVFATGDNLFIGSAGQLKIGDFGHAQYMVDGVVCSYMRGTIQYMAPEVNLPFLTLLLCVRQLTLFGKGIVFKLS